MWLFGLLASVVLASLEAPGDLKKILCNHTQISRVKVGATHGRHVLQVRFRIADYPNIYFRIGVAFTNGDWRSFGGLAVDGLNPEDEAVALFLRVDDDFAADGQRHCRTWLHAHPPSADRDEFGGWKDGPQLKATGFFRTAYVVNGVEGEPPEGAHTDEPSVRWRFERIVEPTSPPLL